MAWEKIRSDEGTIHADSCNSRNPAGRAGLSGEGAVVPAVTKLVIPARLDAIPGVAASFEAFMQDAGFSDPAILDIQLALEEVMANAIEHGYCGSEGTITIHGTFCEGILTVEISDRAPPFDPFSVPNPDITSPLEERKIGGLGIYLVRKVTDTAMYRYEEGKNILTLTKKRDS